MRLNNFGLRCANNTHTQIAQPTQSQFAQSRSYYPIEQMRLVSLASHHIRSISNMSSSSSTSAEYLRSIFLQAVHSVQPAQLFHQRLVRYDAVAEVLHLGHSAVNSTDIIDDITTAASSPTRTAASIASQHHHRHQRINLAGGKRCHLVGFGKAVFGMALATERMLAGRLVSGLLSVPVGTLAAYGHEMAADTRLEVCEGADSNLPDEAAAQTAERILQRAADMTGDDVLIVLISGGGSALLTLPVRTVTIAEKR